MHWFTYEWWQYLLQPVDTQGERWYWRWKVYWCRATGHRGFTYTGCSCEVDPKYSCSNCWDDME